MSLFKKLVGLFIAKKVVDKVREVKVSKGTHRATVLGVLLMGVLFMLPVNFDSNTPISKLSGGDDFAELQENINKVAGDNIEDAQWITAAELAESMNADNDPSMYAWADGNTLVVETYDRDAYVELSTGPVNTSMVKDLFIYVFQQQGLGAAMKANKINVRVVFKPFKGSSLKKSININYYEFR